MNTDHSPPLILASSSRFRRQQLASLGLDFESIAPDIDETLQPTESAEQATARLASTKAQTIFSAQPHTVVIGSDQLCAMQSGELVGKPGTIMNAEQQLARLSGQTVRFFSAVHICHPQGFEPHLSVTEVQFRKLRSAEIERYLQREPDAVFCAGSFMSESLGISLVEKITSDDPSALIGLPLIGTARILRDYGFSIP